MIREAVVERTVAEILAGDYPVGSMTLMGVPGMPMSVDPVDARPFESAVRARLGDRYRFTLVLAGSAMVTRLPEENP